MERYVNLTAQERDLLVTMAQNALQYEGSIRVEGRSVKLSIWEKYGKRRLYVEYPERRDGTWKSGQMFIDLNDENDLQLDFGRGYEASAAMREFLTQETATVMAEAAAEEVDAETFIAHVEAIFDGATEVPATYFKGETFEVFRRHPVLSERGYIEVVHPSAIESMPKRLKAEIIASLREFFDRPYEGQIKFYIGMERDTYSALFISENVP